MHRFLLLTASSALALVACSHPTTTTDGAAADDITAGQVGALPALVCGADATPFMFTIEAAATSAARVELAPPGPGPLKLVGPGADPKEGPTLRLDACIGSATTLKRAIFRGPGDPDFRVIEPKATDRIDGFEDAAFGAPAKLVIDLALAGGDRLLVKGWEDGTTSFVTAGVVSGEAGGLPRLKVSELLAGGLVMGDPLPGDVGVSCGGSAFPPMPKSFSLGTAKFEMLGCVGFGTSGGGSYEIKKITVTDTNPSLTPAEQKPVVLSGAEVARFEQVIHHHNACDSFFLKLPHAEYAATAATAVDESECGKVHPKAPQLSDGAQTARFIVRYTNGLVVEDDATFTHYLFD